MPRHSTHRESQWESKVDPRFLVLADVYKVIVAFAAKSCGGQKQRQVTELEKALISNAMRAHVNLCVAKAVISAQEAGEITVAVANRILTSQSHIAQAGRQLTLIIQRGQAAAGSQQKQVRSLIAQIEQAARELHALFQTKLRTKSTAWLQNVPLILETLAISLIGAKLPAVLAPVLRPLVFRWFCWVKYQTSPKQLFRE
jgi:hypothetical protein